MSKLTAMIGIPRSGKSTFAKQWQLSNDLDGLKRVVVNGDNVRTALHGMRYVHSAEPIVHGIYSTMIRALLLNPNLHVLMDDTHTTAGSIKAVLNMDVDAKFIYIHCSLELAKERATITKQEDLFPVIDRMHTNIMKLYEYGIEDIYGDHPSYFNNEEDEMKFGINRAIDKIRLEVRKVKEYSDRSV